MPERPPKKPATGRGLLRLVCYVHPDEHEALEEYARRKHVSQAEVVRRALRSFLKVED